MNRFNIKLVILSFFILSVFSTPGLVASGKLVTDIEKSQCKEPSEKREWLGKTLQQAESKFGVSSTVETFKMKDVVITEFRGKLEVLFPRSVNENQSIMIKEASWQEIDCVLTLWFRKEENDWLVVDTLYWHKDTDF